MTSLPTLELVLHIDLTRQPDRISLLGLGWAAAGWADLDGGIGCQLGRHGSLALPLSDRDGAFFLQLKLAPPAAATSGSAAPVTKLRVILNGYEIAAHDIGHPVTLTDYVPPEALAGTALLRLQLDRPRGATPGDAPWLSLQAVRLLRVIDRPTRGLPTRDAPEAPPLRELLLDFESLGEGPAFALFRRRHGVRPLDVMQAGHAPLADWLALLDSDFAVFAAPGAVRATATSHPDSQSTWSIRCAGYGFVYDTGLVAATRPALAVQAHETARLAIASRRLRQTLASADKLLLFQQDAPVQDEQIIPLLAAVQDRGPNTLLWVTPADADHPAGSVEVLMNGLLRGYVAPGAGDEAAAGWAQMCRLAWRSWRAMTGTAGEPADAQAA